MGTKKPTKYDQVRVHLLMGNSISSIEAFNRFKVTRLSAIIHTMKHRDHIEVDSATETSADGARYSRYWVNREWLEREKEVDNAAAQEQAANA